MSEAITKATEDLAESLFAAWQTTPCSELDGDHVLKWEDLGEHWKKAWITVASAAPSQPAPLAGEVTDEQIDAVSLDQWGPHHGAPLAAHRAFARAILALRPLERTVRALFEKQKD